MAKLTIRDLNVRGKRVFLRVDYNVPMEEKDGQMVINDDTRIRETLPTLKMLIEQGGKVMMGCRVTRLEHDPIARRWRVHYESSDGARESIQATDVISSAPIRDVMAGLSPMSVLPPVAVHAFAVRCT